MSEVRAFLMALQDEICAAFEAVDGEARFDRREEAGAGGLTRPRVLEGGPVLEKAAVNFSHSRGPALPPAATAAHPAAAGRPFEVVSLSLIAHPRNPYAPTTHMNLRYFEVAPAAPGGAPQWWFGGGADLTPYYGFDEDVRHWHATAKAACAPAGADVYPRLKAACDDYFRLPHRGEPRGVGGTFFEDWTEGGFEASFGLVQRVGRAFLPAYLPLVERHRDDPYGEPQRTWQLIRRGRYVEFNLVQDRGTLYGLQSGRRIESVLASLPPMVAWAYDHRPAPGSPEARLLEHFLKPQPWA